MTDKNWIVKAFHTGGPYQKDADKLKASADKFGIPLDIEAVKSRGSWNHNTHYKPHSIIKAINDHPACDYIIHVDVDAWFMQYPALFDALDCDFGAFYWKNGKTWCSGTVIVRNCSDAMIFLQEWIKLLDADPRQRGDQVAMGRLLNEPIRLADALGLNLLRIPPGYIQGLAPSLAKGEGVIAHDGARKRYVGTKIYTEPK